MSRQITPALKTTLVNQITSTSGIDSNDNIEQLCDPCIEKKHTKNIRHKKMTLTTGRLQEINADLWELHNLSSLLRKFYVGLLLDKFTCKL